MSAVCRALVALLVVVQLLSSANGDEKSQLTFLMQQVERLTSQVHDVQARLDAFIDSFNQVELLTELPCPSGWREVEDYGQYIVIGGSDAFPVGVSTGIPLANASENRAAGAHDHGVYDPGHRHVVQIGGQTVQTNNQGGYDALWYGGSLWSETNQANITVLTSTGVEGTPAPFRVKRLCRYNGTAE